MKVNLIALIHLLVFNVAYSQFSSYKSFGLDDGLPSSTAYFVFKDSQGYLWITTDRGLVKFDGYQFQTFTTFDGLSDNEIFEGFEDSRKRIWFATYNGIPTVLINNQFYNFYNSNLRELFLETGPCYRFIETDNSLWMLNRKAIFRLRNNSIEVFRSKEKFLVSMAYHAERRKIYALMSQTDKMISIDENNRIDSIPLKSTRPTNISKCYLIGNTLYYTSWKHFCAADIDAKDGYFIDFGIELLTLRKAPGDSLIWLGSTRGVYEVNVFTREFQSKFIDQQGVSCIYQDNENSFWITSLSNSLSYFGNDKVSVLNSRNSLPFDYVSLVRKHGDKLLIASDKFRFCIYSLKTKQVEEYYNDADKIPGRGFASTIRKDSKGNYYISFRLVLIKIDKFGKLERIPLKQVTYDYLFTPKYTIAVHYDRISRRPEKESVLPYSEVYDELFVTSRRIYYDSTNQVIYSYGLGGIYKIDVGSFKKAERIETADELSSSVSSIKALNDSILVVGSTLHGLIFLHNDRPIWKLSKREGLSSNYVNCIHLARNEIWIGTDQGINVLKQDPKTRRLELYQLGKRDGIFSNEIQDISIVNDTAYVATPYGLYYFNRNNIIMEATPPKLNMEYFLVNNTNISYGKSNNTYELRSFENNIKVRYTGISFSSFGNIIYRYRLSPVDEHWHLTNSREIQYPSLGPGEYSLSIQCKGSKGGWSEVVTTRFAIKPSFRQTIWARILLVLSIVFIAGVIIHLRFKAVRKSHEIKEKLLKLENEKLEDIKNQAVKDKEIIELEQKALRLHMNPHFIFNAINAIQGFYAGNEVNKAKQFINYFSKLLRMILETSKEKLVPVGTEIEIIRNYLELFLLRFENKYIYDIKVDESIDIDNHLILPMVVQPFVENAVLHGISPMKQQGRIMISFELDNNFIKIIIEDNGIGRRKSEELKMFSKSKSTGIKVTQMRLKHMNEKLIEGNLVEIIDIEEENGNTGTRIILRVPLSELN